MSEIKEYLNELIQDPVGSGLFLPALFFCFSFVLLLIWLLTRDIRLWYWKVNKQINTLSSIDRKLHELSEEITLKTPENAAGQEEETAAGEIVTETYNKPGKLFTEEELELLIRE